MHFLPRKNFTLRSKRASDKTGKANLRLEPLEDRVVPTSTMTYVDDMAGDFQITNDQGAAGLDAGDEVTWNPGQANEVTGLIFETDAFLSIQDAIDNTSAGGTVNVAAGTYNENVIVDKAISLLGAQAGVDPTTGPRGDESIIVASSPFGLEVRADSVTIDGFKFTDYVRDGINVRATNSGIDTSSRSDVVIRNNYFSVDQVTGNQVNGILFGETINNSPSTDDAIFTNMTVSNNLIDVDDDNTARGIAMTSQFATISFDNFDISGNVIKAKNNGIFASANPAIYLANGIEITGNRFEKDGSLAINIGNLDANSKINNNEFIGNQSGAAVNFREPGGEIANNTFENHSNVGLFFFDDTFFPQSSSDATVTGNTFTDNDRHVAAPANDVDLDPIQLDNAFDGLALTSGLRNFYGSLQSAIDDAADGDTVTGEGTFTGDIDVNKAIQIFGNFAVDGAFSITNKDAVNQASIDAQGLELPKNSTFEVNLKGPTDFEMFTVNGPVSIDDVNLDLKLLYTPIPGTSFVLINNDGNDDVDGTFKGLPNGTIIKLDGTPLLLHYNGGDGNDVTLTTLPKPSLAPQIFAAGTSGGTLAKVNVFDAQTNAPLFSLTPFENYDGGVRVGTVDINADGIFDIIVGTAGGVQNHVKVFDGKTGDELRSFRPYDTFEGSVSVGGGDINDDGFGDLIVGAGPGAPGGHVKVFDGQTNAELRSFFAFGGFSGGVNVDGADVSGDGIADLIVGTQTLSDAVRVFDGTNNVLLQEFSAFGGFVGGIFVSAGDTNGDGFADIVVGANGASGGHVKVFNGEEDNSLLHSFLAFDMNFLGGSRVGVDDFDGDGLADVVAGAGASGSHIKRFDGLTIEELDSFFAFDEPTDGVFVG